MSGTHVFAIIGKTDQRKWASNLIPTIGYRYLRKLLIIFEKSSKIVNIIFLHTRHKTHFPFGPEYLLQNYKIALSPEGNYKIIYSLHCFPFSSF